MNKKSENNLSDEEIVNEICVHGKKELFSLLYQRYNERVNKRCYSLIKDKSEASDLSQDIFIKLITKLQDFKNQSSLSTWIYSITYNECINYLRKNKKKVLCIQLEEIIDNIALVNYPEEEDFDEVSKEITIEIAEEFIEQLPESDKLILNLKYYEKAPIKKIMDLMNLSESAVKMRVKRAKAKLFQLLKVNSNKV